ncbi:MAG: Dna2/Cas4 domain-containing protein [Defluviitaleaceae bacterium]|nr:Dna2/Cas4 domain-containing protein [Defluviitaleaceae bacterium]MCL2835128.1 Dna2/Cas4 domain-containing protein [Defluviitaleaceae bacterium]
MFSVKEVKPKLRIRGYRLFYADRKADRKADRDDSVIYGRLLRSERHGLSGKPDFIFNRGNKFIPVELKSGKLNGAGEPRPGDLMQLVSYFVIIQGEFGRKPRQGRLIYGDTMFIIKNRRKLRRRLFRTMSEMRRALESGGPAADAAREYHKCRYCNCRETVCIF